MFICFVVVHQKSCVDMVKIWIPQSHEKQLLQDVPWLVQTKNLPYNHVSHLMSLIIAYNTNICIAHQNHVATDKYECWLRTVQWLITMSANWGPLNEWSLWVLIEDRSMMITMNADWGPFNGWSLWVLIEDRSMTDHYECWLRTVKWLITISADWGPLNDWSLWVLIEDRSMTDHYEC